MKKFWVLVGLALIHLFPLAHQMPDLPGGGGCGLDCDFDDFH